MRVPDNYDAYRQHEAEHEAWLKRQPVCEECNEPIQDDVLYDIDGTIYCEACMKEAFRKWTEDYEKE